MNPGKIYTPVFRLSRNNRALWYFSNVNTTIELSNRQQLSQFKATNHIISRGHGISIPSTSLSDFSTDPDPTQLRRFYAELARKNRPQEHEKKKPISGVLLLFFQFFYNNLMVLTFESSTLQTRLAHLLFNHCSSYEVNWSSYFQITPCSA